jgi:hypothetical protein
VVIPLFFVGVGSKLTRTYKQSGVTVLTPGSTLESKALKGPATEKSDQLKTATHGTNDCFISFFYHTKGVICLAYAMAVFVLPLSRNSSAPFTHALDGVFYACQ